MAFPGTQRVRLPRAAWEQAPEAKAAPRPKTLEASLRPAASALFPEHLEQMPSSPPTRQQSHADRTPSVARAVKTGPTQEHREMIRTGAFVQPEAFLP